MKVFFRVFLPAAFVLATLVSGADTLKLRNGRVLSGQFVGATSSEACFHTDTQVEFSGVLTFPVAQIATVAFEPAVKPSGMTGGLRPAEKPTGRLLASICEWTARVWTAALNSHSQYFAFARSQK